MNIINVDINFKDGINKLTGINLITGDYASTKMVFQFDRTDGTKVLEMKNPSGQLVYDGEILNNEVLLCAVENGHNYSIFNQEGRYIYEVSLYKGDSKLTSVKGELPVQKEQVIIDGEIVEPYLPIFDELMQDITNKIDEVDSKIETIDDKLDQVDTAIEQTNNLNISVTKEDTTTTITLTKKDGTTEETEVEDGRQGERGLTGLTPNIQIGNVTTGSPSSVTRRGTNENPILDFVLEQGQQGERGLTGNGIQSITKTSTTGLVDTYTILYTDNTTKTYEVTNGNGIQSIVKTSTEGKVDTYTITYTNGTTTTFDVTNGEVTQAQFDTLQEETNLILDQIPKGTATGQDITINDSSNLPIKSIKISGNTSQDTTTGKNILPTLLFPNATNNGIALTKNSDNEIVLNGTATAQANHNTDYLEIPSGLSQVTLSGGTSNVSFAILTYTSDKTYISTGRDSGSGITYSIPSNAVYYVENVRIASGVTLNNYVLKAQMESGSSASSYEPPIGITPNPQYPQPIHSVTGDNSILIQSIQLFDKNSLTENAWLNADGTLSLNNNEYYVSDFIPVIPNTDYYKKSSGSARSKYYDKDKQPLNTTTYQDISIGGNAGTFTTSDNCYYIRITFKANGTNTLDNFMINKGTTSQPYQEFQRYQELPLTLGELELNKTPNSDYEDYFMKPSGKNLLENTLLTTETTKNGVTFTPYSDGSVYLSGTATSNTYINLSRYNFGDTPFNSNTGGSSVYTASIGNTSISSNNVFIAYDVNNNYTYIFVKNGASINAKIYPMIRKEGTSSEYEPYNNNKWYLKKKIKKNTFNGTRMVSVGTLQAIYQDFMDKIKQQNIGSYFERAKFINSRLENTYYENLQNFVIIGSATDTLETLQAKFNGGIIYYVLETPEYILLNETLQTQLDNIWNMRTKKNTTNISITSDDLKPYLDIVYRKDLETLLGG